MQQQHRGQRNWLEFFDQAERQFQARAQLLDGLPIDRRVVALLKALDEIARKELSQGRDGAAILRDGTVEISVPSGVIG